MLQLFHSPVTLWRVRVARVWTSQKGSCGFSNRDRWVDAGCQCMWLSMSMCMITLSTCRHHVLSCFPCCVGKKNCAARSSCLFLQYGQLHFRSSTVCLVVHQVYYDDLGFTFAIEWDSSARHSLAEHAMFGIHILSYPFIYPIHSYPIYYVWNPCEYKKWDFGFFNIPYRQGVYVCGYSSRWPKKITALARWDIWVSFTGRFSSKRMTIE